MKFPGMEEYDLIMRNDLVYQRYECANGTVAYRRLNPETNWRAYTLMEWYQKHKGKSEARKLELRSWLWDMQWTVDELLETFFGQTWRIDDGP